MWKYLIFSDVNMILFVRKTQSSEINGIPRYVHRKKLQYNIVY